MHVTTKDQGCGVKRGFKYKLDQSVETTNQTIQGDYRILNSSSDSFSYDSGGINSGTYYFHVGVSDKLGNEAWITSNPIVVSKLDIELTKNMVGSDTFELTASLVGNTAGLSIKSLACGTR